MEDEGTSFGLDFDFNIDLNFDEPRRRATVKPTKDDDNESTKSFEKWEKLAPEMKTKAVEKMDYFTRTRLSYCSKDDYKVVNSAPIEIDSIEINDDGFMKYSISPDGEVEYVYVQIVFKEVSNVKCKIELHFINRGDDTEILWHSYPPRQRPVKKSITSSGCNFYDEAIKFVEKWMKKSRYGVRRLTIELKNWPIETSNVQFLSQCEYLRVCHEDEKSIKWWLNKVDPKNVDNLQIVNRVDNYVLSQDLLSMDHFRVCKQFRLWAKCSFTDEQFVNMKGTAFTFESNTVSDVGINRFILNWVNGKVREDFTSFAIWGDREFVKETIVKNLTVRPWDADFEEEARGFTDDWARICGRHDCNQIYKLDGSGRSATLNISHDAVTFAVTGSTYIWQGRPTPGYSIPLSV